MLLAGASAAHAEFKVGAEIPPFSLKTAAGQAIELERMNGAVTMQLGDERLRPRAIVLHLLQPDCLQCRNQLEALKPLAERFRDRGVVTLGIAHRGTSEDAAAMLESLRLSFPIALGIGSEIAKRFAAGDTLGIGDSKGVIRFAQVGYGDDDQLLWAEALEELLAGKPVTKSGVERARLAEGLHMPAIELPSLRTGKPMRLTSEPRPAAKHEPMPRRVSERESEPRRVSEGTGEPPSSAGRRLSFHDDDGKTTHPKAAVGFFSRY